LILRVGDPSEESEEMEDLDERVRRVDILGNIQEKATLRSSIPAEKLAVCQRICIPFIADEGLAGSCRAQVVGRRYSIDRRRLKGNAASALEINGQVGRAQPSEGKMRQSR